MYPVEDTVFGLLARVPERRENCQSLSSSLFGITSLSEPLQPCKVIRADIEIVFKNSGILISRIPVFDKNHLKINQRVILLTTSPHSKFKFKRASAVLIIPTQHPVIPECIVKLKLSGE